MSNRTAMGLVVFLAGLLAGVAPALAGNAAVSNAAMVAADGKVAAQFDISWNNSWRDATNHDACWVFVKYSADGGVTWRHAALAAGGINPAGFAGGEGVKLEIVVPADKKGAFIRRAEAGTGAVANTGVKLLLDSAAGTAPDKGGPVRIFAVEMVHVPAGEFHVGTPGGTESGHFHDGAGSNTPFLVRGEGAITISNKAGCLWGTGDIFENQIGPPGVLPAAFPKGFAAFYLMKTELSQRQYCDFLNTLTAGQQSNRHPAGLHFNDTRLCVEHRNHLKKTGGSPAVFGCDANDNAGPATRADAAKLNETNDGEWVACNWISWMDLAAYLDWAALRPMTELEFEKACRGPLPPVANECAWGNATLVALGKGAMKNKDTAAEVLDVGNCNVAGYHLGPIRCGSFADAGAGRTNTGAGYCGALDLSGNVWERTVSAGHPAGRVFTGQPGDGALTAAGNADVALWPGLVGGEVSEAAGVGLRGGYWIERVTTAFVRVSDRSYAAGLLAVRYPTAGGRGARAAP